MLHILNIMNLNLLKRFLDGNLLDRSRFSFRFETVAFCSSSVSSFSDSVSSTLASLRFEGDFFIEEVSFVRFFVPTGVDGVGDIECLRFFDNRDALALVESSLA